MKKLIKAKKIALQESVNTLGSSHHSTAIKKLDEINIEIKEKQERIDNFATAQLNGIMSLGPGNLDWFKRSLLENIWDIAEEMEAERDRRINELNK